MLALLLVGCAGDAADEVTTSSTTTTTAVTTTASPTATTSTRAVPSLPADEIAVIGHSNSSSMVDAYRAMSSQDRVVAVNQGGQHARVWGDPTEEDFENAWSNVERAEPVGGYKAVWVFLGFAGSWEGVYDATDFEAWADEVYDQITTRFPTVEFIWWSPMNTYFATDPGDGDAADLVALDPWGTNPSSLTTWKDSDIDSRFSWETTEYAIAQGYADDYGPWVNLTAALTDRDRRHPSDPEGEEHGGNVLLEFFDGSG